MPTIVVAAANAQPAPYTLTLSDIQEFRPESVFASWDGTGASGAFLPALTFVSSDGHIFSRTFPTTPIPAGGSADVSYAPFPGGISPPAAASLHQDISSDTVTLAPAMGGPGTIVPWTVVSSVGGIWDYTTITNPKAKLAGLLVLTLQVEVHSGTPMTAGSTIFVQLTIPGPAFVFPGVMDCFGVEEASAAIPAPSVLPTAAGLLNAGNPASLIIANNDVGPIDVTYIIRSDLVEV